MAADSRQHLPIWRPDHLPDYLSRVSVAVLAGVLARTGVAVNAGVVVGAAVSVGGVGVASAHAARLNMIATQRQKRQPGIFLDIRIGMVN